ncbi:MAG: peptidoglycan recognition protein family protein [Planctomycetota bacterium]
MILRRAILAVLAATILAGCTDQQLREMDHLGMLEPLYRRPLPAIGDEGHPRPRQGESLATAASANDRPVGSAPGRRQWRYIVIHHSATDGGNAAQFDAHHRDQGMDELGYHFVITNGRGGPDGAVQVGPRWRKQKHGAHCGGTPNNEYNEHGIGICLVGNFDHSRPTASQRAALDSLVRHLTETYGIPAKNVVTHQDAPLASTECPGRSLRDYVFRRLRPAVGVRIAAR